VVLDSVGAMRLLVHLHSVIAGTLTLFLLLSLIVFAAAALALEILAAFVVGLGGGVDLSTCHLGIVDHGVGISSCGLATLDFLLLLLFLNTVLVSIGGQVGLWLVGREFGRSRVIGVPVSQVSDVSLADWADVPFDSKSRNSRLFRQNVAADLLEDWLGRWVGVQLLRIILIVDIVTDADELSAVIGTGEEDDGDA
jgi:hypothetical protein